MLRLTQPTPELMPSYIEALVEGHRCGASKVATPEEIAALGADPQAWLDRHFAPQPKTRINELGQEVERVPQTTVWLAAGSLFLGDAGIRHYLTPQLEQSGGHIGYGIRPLMQGKGHATAMLRLCLLWMRDNLQAEKALLSCRVSNIASARVIEKNGGQRIDITPHPYAPGEMQSRYWVPVPAR